MDRTFANIALVGMMGCGKSSIGRLLAERVRLPLIDVDAEIAAAEGRSIPEIFAQDGEAAFRRLEAAHIARAAAADGAVIATGGGAVLLPENRDALAARCWVVWLQVDADEVLRRTRGGGRPVLEGHADLLDAIRRLIAARAPLYAMADHNEDTSHARFDEVADRIVQAWRAIRAR